MGTVFHWILTSPKYTAAKRRKKSGVRKIFASLCLFNGLYISSYFVVSTSIIILRTYREGPDEVFFILRHIFAA